VRVLALALLAAPAACSAPAPPAPPPPAPAKSPSVAPVPRVAEGEFVRGCPRVYELPLEDCTCGGRGGKGCGDAFRDETDPVVRRYILRMVEATARVYRDDFQVNWFAKGEDPGMPHAEVALYCKDRGACSKPDPDGVTYDSGYACLTLASQFYVSRDAEARKNGIERVKRACKCDLPNARIPVMAGYGLVACDESGNPQEFGLSTELALAKEILACAGCHERAACVAEVERLHATDSKLAAYIAEVHAPRCRLRAKDGE